MAPPGVSLPVDVVEEDSPRAAREVSAVDVDAVKARLWRVSRLCSVDEACRLPALCYLALLGELVKSFCHVFLVFLANLVCVAVRAPIPH